MSVFNRFSLSDVTDLQICHRDFEELLARAIPAPAGAAGADQSGAISFGKIFKGIFGRDEGELLSRE